MNKVVIAENLAMFLVDRTGSPLGRFTGRLSAEEQRKLFGQYLGKGTIVIDGDKEILAHVISVCFGHDYHYTFDRSWSSLDGGESERQQEAAAEAMIGELIREGKKVYYISHPGLAYREGTKSDLKKYLIRNGYA